MTLPLVRFACRRIIVSAIFVVVLIHHNLWGSYVELQAAENIVRTYMLNEKPVSHGLGRRGSVPPRPDEFFDFPGGTVAVEYEIEFPVVSMQNYWWLLNRGDVLKDGKKLAVVVIFLDRLSQPKDQVDRQKSTAKELEESFPGFRAFFISFDEASSDTIAAALAKACDFVKA